MKLYVLVVLWVGIYAFPAPEKTSAREPRFANLLGNYKNWDPASVAEYLGKFGYISKSRMKSSKLSGLVDINSFKKSIKEFQRMAGIKPTGKMDAETVRMMELPRCGVEDTVGAFTMGSEANIANSKFRNKNQRRRAMRRKRKKSGKSSEGKRRGKRYNLEGGKWSKTTLKYRILKYTQDMTKQQVRKSIKRALNLWADHTILKFVETDTTSEADLKISFGSASHGDPYPFDGSGGTLAHAFFPSDGRAHFDEDEEFSYKDGGVNLFIVAAHEFGHSLGLAHSSVPNSLMAPFYQGYVPNYQLHADDIAAIQQLYGKKAPNPHERKKPPTPVPTNKPPKRRKRPKDAMQICGDDVSFDSMHYNHKEGILYAFKGVYYWKIKDDEEALPGYPRRIRKYWKGLPGNINATVHSKTTGRTYFFKGNKVWKYTENRTLEKGFPKPCSALGLPSNPQAATQWGRDGLIYIFKNGYFHRFYEYQSYNGRNRYGRKSIEKYWEGIPAKIDAAMQWRNGQTYFVKGDDFWRFAGLGKPADEHYPRSFKRYWVGCNNKNNIYAKEAKEARRIRKNKLKKQTKNKK